MDRRLSVGGRPGRAAAAKLLKPVSCLLLALGASSVIGQTQPARTVDIVPAWEGHYRSNRATELTLVAHAGNAAVLRARATGSIPVSSTENDVAPGETRFGIAVRPSGPELSVTTSFGVSEPLEHRVELIALSEPLVAIVAETMSDLMPWLASAEGFRPLPVAMADLPRTAAGYEPLTGLAMSGDVRPALEPAQRNALSVYLQGCGRVFTTDAATQAALADGAGCDGRFITLIGAPGEIGSHVRASAAPLPRYDQLRALLEAPPRLVYVAALFLALYCLFIAMLALRGRTPGWALIATPVLASALMLAVWFRAAPESRLLVWAEQHEYEPARYRAVLELFSQGIGTIDIPLEPTLGLPVIETDRPAELARPDSSTQSLHWEPALLSRLMLGVEGSMRVVPDLSVELPSADDASAPAVLNRGEDLSTGAILAHDRRYYRVPPLAPGESWTPADATPSLSRVDVPSPLTAAGPTALLIPLTADQFPPELPMADLESGWVLRRPALGPSR